jgi:hypothetical protein
LEAYLLRAQNKSQNIKHILHILFDPGRDITSFRTTVNSIDNKEAHGTTFMTETGKSTGGFGQKGHSPAKQFDDFNATMKDDPFTSGKKEKETGGKAKTGIASMNAEALTQDVKQRRGSWGFITHQANRLYGTKSQLPQLSLDDFVHNVEFTYGIPLIVLDFIDSLTGSDFIQKLHDHINPPKNVERFDTSA